MVRYTRAMLGAASWGVGAVAWVFLVCVAAGGMALATGRSTSVPGIFSASREMTNGLPSLSFDPHGTGILVVVLVLTVLGAISGRHRCER